MKKVSVLFIGSLLFSGCINSNPRIAVNLLTSRSAATEIGGSSNRVEAVSGMEGGGTVSPQTTLTPAP